MDHLMIMTVLTRHPEATLMALRTVGSACLPINHKIRCPVALLGLSLPTGIRGHRSEEIDAVLDLALDQMLSRHIACIHELFLRQDFALSQRILNRQGHVKV